MFALLLKLRLLTAWRQPATASSLLVSDVTFKLAPISLAGKNGRI